MCVGRSNDSDIVFSISETITANTTVNNGVATASFGSVSSPIHVLEGTFLTSQFIVDGSLEQRFVLDNANIDTSSIVAYVGTPGVS